MIRPRYARRQHRMPWYVHDLIGVFLAAGALFIFLALISHNPHDATWFYATTDTAVITNWCGTVGAYAAALLLYFFGASALYVVIVLGMCAYNGIHSRSYTYDRDRMAAVGILACTTAAWCYTYQIDFLGASFAGGIVGMYFYKALYTCLDAVGALLFMYMLFVMCLLLITRLSVVRFFYYGCSIVQRCGAAYVFVPRVYRAFGDARTLLKKMLVGNDDEQACVAYGDEPFDDALYDGAAWSDTATVQPCPAPKPLPAPVLVPSSVQAPTTAPGAVYALPDVTMFPRATREKTDQKDVRELEAQARVLEEKLARFGVAGSVTSIKRGPVVTLFEYQPDIDSKISKIIALEDDLALALQAMSIRIIAPIPGRSVVGFEVANKQVKDVSLAAVIQSTLYTEFAGKLPLVLGQDTVGDNVVVDLAAMPHLLVAGSTGSGKSVALNAMLMSLLCTRTPDELKLILIDPKRLEFAPYADIAHLIFPIVTDPRKSCQVLLWVVKEMETRYASMAKVGSRSMSDYNKDTTRESMPFIVVVIDELADLMMTAGREIEDLITRIAQMARAAGIHLIVATQRPSVDVITGLIKANFPSRISFRVASKIDSRTILDCGGADKLVGRGDMLFLDSRASLVRRVHGAYVSDREVENLVAYIRAQRTVAYHDLSEEMPRQGYVQEPEDELYNEVVHFLQGVDEVSISLLQRRFRIGYNRSARIIDTLESRGLIMPSENGKTRKIIK